MRKNFNEILYDNETVKTERLILRKFKKSDATDIFEYGSDAEVLKYLVWEGVKSVEAAVSAVVNFYWSKPGIFAIALDGKCIGGFDLKVEPEHEKASFGYVLNRRFWGQGLMTEALFAVLRLCFEGLDLNRVEATHYVGNEGSGRVMQKCGMEFEGIAKQEVKVKGVFRDTVHYGITKDGWSVYGQGKL